MPKRTNRQKLARNMNVIRMTRKLLSKKGPTMLHNVIYTPADIEAQIQEHADAMLDVAAKRIALRVAIAKERALDAKVHTLVGAMKTWMVFELGPTSPIHDAFGWGPRKKRGPKTVQGKLEGQRKGARTRIRRGTIGKRQKAKIKG